MAIFFVTTSKPNKGNQAAAAVVALHIILQESHKIGSIAQEFMSGSESRSKRNWSEINERDEKFVSKKLY